MMSNDVLLQMQQSLLQHQMHVNRKGIHYWQSAQRTDSSPEWVAEWKMREVALHKKQYALSKLLKNVEKQIRDDADRCRHERVVASMTAIAQEQGEYE